MAAKFPFKRIEHFTKIPRNVQGTGGDAEDRPTFCQRTEPAGEKAHLTVWR